MKSNDCQSLLRRARAQLQKLLGDKRKVYELALVLHQIARKRLYATDYPSFAAFVRAEVGGMTDKNARLQVHLIDCGFTREQFQRIGKSKLCRLMPVNAGKCPYCARRRGACWILPCLGLETDLEKGVTAVQRWAGPNFTVTLKRPNQGGHARAV